MASTNKTANLKLNQWVLTDPLLMEDMNEDNQKLDAAVAANPYVKLMDVTTSANAQQVDLDVSGIDFTKYSMIQVLLTAKVTPLSVAMSLFTKINGGGSSLKDTSSNGSLTSVGYVGYAMTCTDANHFSNLKLEFSGFPPVITSAYLMNIKVNGSACYNGNFYVQEQIGVKLFGASTKPDTINFVTNDSSVYIKSGSRFEIYGVKK